MVKNPFSRKNDEPRPRTIEEAQAEIVIEMHKQKELADRNSKEKAFAVLGGLATVGAVYKGVEEAIENPIVRGAVSALAGYGLHEAIERGQRYEHKYQRDKSESRVAVLKNVLKSEALPTEQEFMASRLQKQQEAMDMMADMGKSR